MVYKSLKFYIGQSLDVDAVSQQLIDFGYIRVRDVAAEGEFAQRGEVIDLFPVNFDGPIRIAMDEDQIRLIVSYNIRSTKTIWRHQMVMVLPRKTSAKKIFDAATPLNHFVDIRDGDYVVHNTHGIGRFLGIKPINVNDVKKSHLVIEYQNGEPLFVPEHNLNLVQKYVGFNKKPPRLHKLGSKEWQRIRNQIQRRLQRVAAELLHLQALRASLKGHAFSTDTPWQKQFEKKFPFTETPDQIQSITDIKRDMESTTPMDRLLCGDVGFGKTEVALRAAFKAVMDNKQVAILVPTTILAEQHFFNFTRRLAEFPVNVAMLSRFRTKTEQTKIVAALAEGTVDIVIGTHRLLSKDIAFKKLGLIIIDEEQRFGVKAKERLKHFKLLVDVMTMTATPIPRTLYMAVAGARDMSIISTPPQQRIPVATQVAEFDEKLIQKVIRRELRRKGQVFFLHNRVEDIERISHIIARLVPKARIAVGHGQMPSRHLEKIMLQFLKGDIDVLVCTTIIESGIDVPNANTLIVNRADHFGLADLHQLRGRVGRFTHQAYAYFLVPSFKILPEVARIRLQALEKYSELGSGFQLAFEDLQIRGAGNLLGEEQSGYIGAVGFDLYCRLLKESVDELKQTKETPLEK